MPDVLGPIQDFTENLIIRIPSYQRGYSWEKSNWDDLVGDVLKVGNMNHYCGPIVYSTQKEQIILQGAVPQPLKIVHIEDGQQRISTLIFAAWNFIKTVEDNPDLESLGYLVSDLRQKVVFYASKVRAPLSEFNQPRLKSENQQFNRFLEDLFAGRDAKPTNAPMRRIVAINDVISKYFEGQSVEELETIAHKLFSGLLFVFIDLSQRSINPHVAFHTINSRGVPLREFDKVKNGVMSVAEQNQSLVPGLPEDVESTWFKVISSLDQFGLANEEDQFLGMSYALHFKTAGIPSTRKLAIDFLSQFEVPVEDDQVSIVNKAIMSWKNFVDPYTLICRKDKQSLYSADKEDWNNYIDNLRRLDSLKLAGIVQPLLIAAERVLDSDNDKAAFSGLLEKFVFRVYAVGKRRIDYLKKDILNQAQNLADGTISISTVRKKIIGWIIEDGDMQKAVNDLFDTDRLHYGRWEPNRLHYFLLEYEHYLNNYIGHPLIWKDHSIEHVSPQQQSGAGSEYLRFGALHEEWQVAFENATAWKVSLHRLGNLCLTKANATLGNKPWTQKKVLYADPSSTHSEKQLCEFVTNDSWDTGAIMRREVELAKFFVSRWNVGLDTEEIVELPGNFKSITSTTHVGSVVVIQRLAADFQLEAQERAEVPEDESGNGDGAEVE